MENTPLILEIDDPLPITVTSHKCTCGSCGGGCDGGGRIIGLLIGGGVFIGALLIVGLWYWL